MLDLSGIARGVRRRRAMAATLVAVGLVVGTGCGSDDGGDDVATAAPTTQSTTPAVTSTEESQEATVVEIPAAEAGLAFAEERVTAPAGTITLRMPNPAALEHNIAIDEPVQEIGEIVGQGGVSEITFEAPPGEYQYYCSVPGHREAGMVGTLVVE